MRRMSWWVGCGDIYYNYDLRPAERVNECPYCGAARINGLIGTIPECGHRTTIYECGSDIFQVDFACGTSRQSRFADVVDHVYWQVTRFNNISPVCTEMSGIGLDSDII